VWHYGENRKTHKVLMAKPGGKRLLGGPSCTWESDIETHLKGMYGRAWTGLIWLRIVTNGRL